MTYATDCTAEAKLALEQIVDKHGISSVLMALSEICGEKADHIEENWQDKPLAKRWNTVSGAIGCLVPDVARRGL